MELGRGPRAVPLLGALSRVRCAVGPHLHPTPVSKTLLRRSVLLLCHIYSAPPVCQALGSVV